VSFGPFQLGDLPVGAIREIRSRTLREQLGAGLIERSKADFDAPVINLAPEVARSATRAAAAKPASRAKGPKREKVKRGMVRDGTLDRLTTRAKPERNSKGPKPRSRKKP
ncbi:MAG: pseudouridine synthase, partial [Pseudomonadota bacterium]